MQRTRVTLLASALTGVSALAWASPPANEELVCRVDAPDLELSQVLRAISLDIRGVVPSAEEYAAIDGMADIPEALIDEWLQSEEFVQRAVRWHREKLWNGLGTNISFTSFRYGMSRNADGVWFRSNQSQTLVYRGGTGTVTCANTPATFAADGSIEFTTVNGARVEGYVMVEPYWAPGTQVKVCAFDAQEQDFTAAGVDCRTSAGTSQAECGCGPNLRLCRQGDFLATLSRSFTEDVDRRIADVIRNNRPYTELFTSRKAFVNGPIVHFLRYQTGIPQDVRFEPVAYDVATLPDIPYTARDDWREIELPMGHAGVLTTPAFLSRFQTNRARADRMHNSFFCQPFQAPASGIPVGDAAAQRELDLQKRDGCKYCHAILEPSAAHWGRWRESGAGFMAPQAFPAQSPVCTQCAQTGMGCNAECTAFYLTRATQVSERPYLGMLRALYFLRDDHRINVELGPKYLADSGFVDNRIPACLATQTMEKLAGRSVLPAERQMVQEDLSRAFVQSGYNYRAIVKAMVMNPTYRRMR